MHSDEPIIVGESGKPPLKFAVFGPTLHFVTWNDDSPTVPGWYVWADGHGKHGLYELKDANDGSLRTHPEIASLPASEWDGWWMGPLPEPPPWVYLPRTTALDWFAHPKRQKLSQKQVRELLDSGHRHTDECYRNGCV